MRIPQFFWGLMLLILGVLLLLENLGIFKFNVWGVFWPVFMIVAGGWLLVGMVWRPALKTENAAVALEGAARLRLKVRHGAGELKIAAGSDPTQALAGVFEGGLELDQRREGDELRVKLKVPEGSIGWDRQRGYNWTVGLNRETPLMLDVKCGASRSQLDLTGLRLAELDLSTGASDTELTLPEAAGLTQVKVNMGAASLKTRLPAGLAARIQIRGGLASADVDTQRFPRQGDYYQSPDYETAVNKVEMVVAIGAGSVEIR